MMKKMRYGAILRSIGQNFRYMRRRRICFLTGGILGLGSLAISFLMPQLFARFIEMVQAGLSFDQIMRETVLSFVLLIALIPLVCMGSYWQKASANFATVNMQRDVFGHVMHMPVSALETDRADKVLRATANVRSAASMFSGYTMTMFFKFIICFFGGLVILLIKNWPYALIGIVVSAFMFWIATCLNVRLREMENRALQADSSLGAVMLDMVKNLTVVKLFGLEQTLRNQYAQAGEHAYHDRLRYKIMRGATDGVLDFMGYSAQALAMLAGLLLLGAPGTFSELVYVASIFSLMLSGVRELGNVVLFIQRSVVSSERVYELLDLPAEAESKTTEDIGTEKAITLRHVSFSYAQGKPVLRDLNLTIPYGKKVGIVGGSGCGKTTLIKLLAGFYEPTNGYILLGNVSTANMRKEDIRAFSAYVPQDAQLFDGTIAENVTMFAGDEDRSKVLSCLREVALELPPETRVGENGAFLSGGQAQRVALARAIYKDAPVYLFDEVSSALDNETEQAIQRTIDNELKGRTVICVAHRLNTIRNADVIIYMEKGAIKEIGTHDELCRLNGDYVRLWTQFTMQNSA